MSIDRKFKMFSTKEWIQFLQYKLSPEREKELELHLDKDIFLKEAVETIGDKENRALAYQSISLLINEVQHYTGVSESKILKSKDTTAVNTESPINWRLVGFIILGVMLLGLLGYGIFYFLSSTPVNEQQDQTMVEAESVSSIQSYADSSSMPLETIPSVVVAASIPADTVTKSTPKSVNKSVNPSSSNAAKSNPSNTNSINQSSTNSSVNVVSQKERELFNQAQEIYKQGNREEAKRILRELKSYDNPMKSQAETILKNMEN